MRERENVFIYLMTDAAVFVLFALVFVQMVSVKWSTSSREAW